MNALDTTRDPEDIRELRTELEQIIADGLEVWQRQDEARNVRFNIWEGQSPDGRKHAAAMGADPLPFEGASDARIPAVDSIIGDKVALAKQAIFRAQVQATPVEPNDAPKAASVTALLRWLRDCEMRAELETEVELSAQHFFGNDPALAVVEVNWRQDITLVRRQLSFDELGVLYVTGESNPDNIAPDDPRLEPAMLADFQDLALNPLRDREFTAWLTRAYPGVTPAAVKSAVRTLRKEGSAELPVPVVRQNRPGVQTLNYMEDIFFPVGTADLQRARSIHRREWISEVELRERVVTQRWSQSWVDTLLDKGRGQSIGDQTGRPVLDDISLSRPGGAVNETDHLYEIWWSYERRADELGVPGIYLSIWNISATEECAKCELHDDPGGGYPFYCRPRERLGRQLTDSRGLTRPLATHQQEIKTQRDARANYTQLVASPPRKTLMQRGAFELILGPNAQIPVQRMDDFELVQMPPFMNASVEMEATTRREFDEYAGRQTSEQEPNRIAMLQQAGVDSFFGLWREVMSAVLRQARRFYTPEELARVTGPGGESLALKPEDIYGEWDVMIEIDTRDLNMEFAMKKMKAFGDLRSLDPAGILDLGPLVEWAAYSLDPVLGRRAIKPQTNVTQKEISDEKNNLAQMAVGVEPEMPEQGINAQLRLQTMQQHIGQSPKLAQLYQGDELFRALVENRQKYLMQQVTQEQNKQIGRLGTAPLQGPGANAAA
jgi:hypothetical protein